tara:strand:+ start:2485 stop:3429 length:945 start_codon:yes stop_codon:yes gene_type:complete
MNINKQSNDIMSSNLRNKKITEYLKDIKSYQGKPEIIDSIEARIFAFTEYIVKVHREEISDKKFFESETKLYKLLRTIDSNLCPDFEIEEDLKIIKIQKYDCDLQQELEYDLYLQNIYTIRYIFKQIVDKLYVIHSNNIFHGDLKLENIVIKGDYTLEDFGEFELRFIDFSFSGQLANKTDKLVCSRGTPNYAAPEVGTFTRINPFAADIWSLGSCFHSLISGSLLYEKIYSDNYKNLVNHTYDFYTIHNKFRTEEDQLDFKYVKLFEKLIYGCCNKDAEKRWTIEQVKNFVDIDLDPPIIYDYTCDMESIIDS